MAQILKRGFSREGHFHRKGKVETADETANRRRVDMAKQLFPFFAVSLFCRNSQTTPRMFDQPFVRLVDHLHELADDFFVRVVDTQKLIMSEITVVQCE